MTDARAVAAADVYLLGAAAAGQLADRYRARGGWRPMRTDRPVAAGAGPAGRVGGGPVEAGRRVRRLVTAGLLAVTPGQSYDPRPYRLTDAGYAVLHAHSSRDLRRWWMSGTPARDDVSFYPARTARQAPARHRAASLRDHTPSAVRPLDGPLTTGEVLRRAGELDAGWAHAWALAARRGLGEVPTGPVDADTAGRLLPAEVRNTITAHINARSYQRREHLAAGLDPPDVLPCSRHGWHAWLGTAAATADADDRAHDDGEAVPTLSPVLDAPPPNTRPASAVPRAFPPLRPGAEGPTVLHTPGPVSAPARPEQTRHGPRR